MHARQCRDANCRLPSCQKIKRVVFHAKGCWKCLICRGLIALYFYHAKHCTENKCQVPFCLQIKHKLRQQQLQHRFKKTQMLHKRIASMQRSTPTTSAHSTSQQSPTVTGIQQQPIPSNSNPGKPVSGPSAAALQAAMAAQEEASMPPPPVQAPTQKVPMNSAMNKGGWPQNSTYPTMQQNPMNPPPMRPSMQPNPMNTGMQIQSQGCWSSTRNAKCRSTMTTTTHACFRTIITNFKITKFSSTAAASVTNSQIKSPSHGSFYKTKNSTTRSESTT